MSITPSFNTALWVFVGLSVAASSVCLIMIADHLILKIAYIVLVLMGFVLMYLGYVDYGIITLVLINIFAWVYALWVSGNSTKAFR